MFEYIKRVSIAIKFISQKMDAREVAIKDILNKESIEFLKLAQDFRSEDFELEILKELEMRVHFIIDLMDYARVDNSISSGNAKIFIESLTNFLKFINHLEEQIYSLPASLSELRENDETLSRKMGKNTSQNIYENQNVSIRKVSNFNFSEVPVFPQKSLYFSNDKTDFSTPSTGVKTSTNAVDEEENTDKKAPKKEEIIEDTQNEKRQRKERVLKLLSMGGGSIKEVSKKMKDVTEKTVQRDLLELMRERKVIMLGQKRWAKYYIK